MKLDHVTDADRVNVPSGAALSAKELAVVGFQKFLHENFASPKQVARAFYVEERTAENWWAARNRASAEIIMLAHGMAPASAKRHLTLVIENAQPVELPAPAIRSFAAA